jgi:DNA-binding NarL/FixJ family response regulator
MTDVPTPIRVVLADDHSMVLDGLEELLSLEPDMAVVASCRTGEEALAALRMHQASVLVLDLRMPGMDGLDVLRAIENAKLPTRVVVFTAALDDDEMVDALRLGARGFVLKEMSPRLLLQCIRTVHAGGQWLERQLSFRAIERLLRRELGMRRIAGVLGPLEMGIVRAVASGVRGNKEIADRFHVSEDMLKIHLHHIYEKLGVDSRLALMRYAKDNALI